MIQRTFVEALFIVLTFSFVPRAAGIAGVRYVRIDGPTNDALVLNEVQVYPCNGTTGSVAINKSSGGSALGGNCDRTSSRADELANDGLSSCNANTSGTFCTDSSSNFAARYWQVDLGGSFDVCAIAVLRSQTGTRQNTITLSATRSSTPLATIDVSIDYYAILVRCSASTCRSSGVTCASCTTARCSNHGIPANNSQYPACSCTCAARYMGPYCEIADSCTASQDCNNHASNVTGVYGACGCTCQPEWTGASCNVSNVCTNASDCNGRARNVSGNRPSCTCICQPEWTGASCNVSNVCTNASDCNAHSVSVSGNRPSCMCTCRPEWTGASCNQSNLCTNMDCHNNSLVVRGNRPNCTCWCSARWKGPSCGLSQSHSLSEAARSLSMTATLMFSQSVTPSHSRVVTTSATQTESTTPEISPSATFSATATPTPLPTESYPTPNPSTTLTDTQRATTSLFTSLSNTLVASTSPTPSPTQTLPLPHLTDELPVTVAADATILVTTVLTSILSGAAAGGAMMQVALSTASCAKDTDEELTPPAMYLVSPFVGNNYGMVFGNMGLCVVVGVLHYAAVYLVARRSSSSYHEAMISLRFPNGSLLFAALATPGILLGGWRALWVVIRASAVDESDFAGMLICFAASVGFIAGLMYVMLHIRSWITTSTAAAPPWLSDILAGEVAECCAVDYSLLPNWDTRSARFQQWIVALGPSGMWLPSSHRRMFAIAINDYILYDDSNLAAKTMQHRWVILNAAVLPWIVAATSALRPAPTWRVDACNSVLLTVASIVAVYAVCVAWARPMRVGIKNYLGAFSSLILSVTCVFSSPMVRSAVGNEDAETVRAVASILQSATSVLIVAADVISSLWIESNLPDLRQGSDIRETLEPEMHCRSPPRPKRRTLMMAEFEEEPSHLSSDVNNEALLDMLLLVTLPAVQDDDDAASSLLFNNSASSCAWDYEMRSMYSVMSDT